MATTTAHQFTADEVVQLKAAFDIFDEDRSGAIDARELGAILNSLGRTTPEAEVQKMIASVDKNGSSTEISFDRFLLLLWRKKKEQAALESYRSAFRVFNSSGSGKLSTSEVRILMSNLGRQLTDEEVDEMMFEADEDKDRHISFDEFVAALEKARDMKSDPEVAAQRRGWSAEHINAMELWGLVASQVHAVAEKGSVAGKCIRPSRVFRPTVFKDTRIIKEQSKVVQPVLNGCRQGDTIVLAPGKYTDPLTLLVEGCALSSDLSGRPAEVDEKTWIARRTAETIIEVNSKNPAVMLKCRQCKLQNLTIINKGGPAIIVEQGYGEIEGCIVSGELAGIIVRNRSFPVISNTTVEDCRRGGGIYLKESRAIIEGCLLRRNCDGGVVVERSSQPWISKCTIVDGQGSGLVFIDGALGVVTECVVERNGTQGIWVQSGVNPVVHNNRVINGKGCGIKVTDGARGIYDGNFFSNNGEHDMDIIKEGNATVTKNNFAGGPSTAVFVAERGIGVFENNTFGPYEVCAAVVRDYSNVTLIQNKFTCSKDHGLNGLLVENNVLGRMHDNQFIGWKHGFSHNRTAVLVNGCPAFVNLGSVVQEDEKKAGTESMVNILGSGLMRRKSLI